MSIMRVLFRKYREEIFFLLVELLLMYGVTKLYTILHRPLVWDGEYSIYIPPAAVFLLVTVYCFRNRCWLFPIGASVILSLGVGLVFYEPPQPGALIPLWDWLYGFGSIFVILDFFAAVLAAILGNLTGFAADKIQEKLQKNKSE